ncbi:hypothetical protein DFA_07508 [Cavenderia fasciculata]|uniref:Protein S-acyltransferase n=1 Tax=Cavenderia fasciculata TaxID=261658 RepID=F4PWM0_CACFS|nr:uncharacterized protein DFA_07508 [Cavenderia fasciculata]EGG20384.1 hypothetical protein DFA_07508 [Cavenderia fasciculata]|eukprot:XP_004367367.1 hypothetical protein DFA_07508 [Cavenderia fasciculata]
MGCGDGWMYILTRISGPFFVGGGTALITLVVFMYFIEILPSLLPPYESYMTYLTQPHVVLDILVSFYIASNLYFNYYKTITVDPGSPSFPATSSLDDSSSPSFNNTGDSSSSSGINSSTNGSQLNDSFGDIDDGNVGDLPLVIDFNVTWAYCKKCSRPKPPRCHHCNVGCLFVVLHSLALFYNGSLFGDKFDEITRFLIITSFLLASLLMLVMGGFFVFHLYLICTGQTTIENLGGPHSKTKKRNYNLGWKANLEMVLGKGKYWFSGLLPTNRLPKGDGYYFMTKEMYDDYLRRQNEFTGNNGGTSGSGSGVNRRISSTSTSSNRQSYIL